jgi:hypothetical protein
MILLAPWNVLPNDPPSTKILLLLLLLLLLYIHCNPWHSINKEDTMNARRFQVSKGVEVRKLPNNHFLAIIIIIISSSSSIIIIGYMTQRIGYEMRFINSYYYL